MTKNTAASATQVTTMNTMTRFFIIAVNNGTTVTVPNKRTEATNAIALGHPSPLNRLNNERGKANDNYLVAQNSSAEPIMIVHCQSAIVYLLQLSTTPRHSGAFGFSAQTNATMESPETGHQ